MIVILGLIILVAAVVLGVAGVLANSGSGHAMAPHSFAVFGYHVTGSTGTLLLYGIVLGAIGAIGLVMLLAGARRSARRGRFARSELKQSTQRVDTIGQDRDELLHQREVAAANPQATTWKPSETSQRSWRHPLRAPHTSSASIHSH